MKSGKTGGMSGREMFMFNPSMVSTHVEGEDDEEGGEFDLGIRDNDDDPAVKVFTMLCLGVHRIRRPDIRSIFCRISGIRPDIRLNS